MMNLSKGLLSVLCQHFQRTLTYFRFSFRFFKKGSCQLLGKYVHEVLVNRLGGLSLPRKSVVRLTDRPDMTLDVYRGRKTTMQQCNKGLCL